MSCQLMATDYNSQPDDLETSIEFYVASSLCYDPFEPSLTPTEDYERKKLKNQTATNV